MAAMHILVGRWWFDVIDDEHRLRLVARFELETELLLKRGVDVRQVRVRGGGTTWRRRAGLVRLPSQLEVELTCESRAIEHRAIDTIRQARRQRAHRHCPGPDRTCGHDRRA